MVTSTVAFSNDKRLSWRFDLLLMSVYVVVVFLLVRKYDLFEIFYEVSRKYEEWELDEFISVGFFMSFGLMYFSLRRWWEAIDVHLAIRQKNRELKGVIAELNQLRGVIPICSSCKKIRDDEGVWNQLEAYIHSHSDAEFTHGVCPDCYKIQMEELDWQTAEPVGQLDADK